LNAETPTGLFADLLTNTAEVRLAAVVFIGLAIFQSSQSLTIPKLAYLLLFTLAALAALLHLWMLRSTPLFDTFKPLLAVSLLLLLLLATSAGVARHNGSAMSVWLRDASPYFLTAFVPVLAIDFATGRRPSLILPLFVVAGSLSTLSYSAEWLGRRHLAQLGVTKLGLPSFLLPMAILSYAAAAALMGGVRRWLWAGYALSLSALLLLTGNRTSLLGVASPLVMLAVSKKIEMRRVPRLIAIAALAFLVVASVTLVASAVAHIDLQYLASRFESIPRLISRPWTDPSFQIRAAQSADALQVFRSAPFLGSGPGHIYHWTDYYGLPQSGFEIDTGLAFAAKFGLVGIVVLVVYALGYLRFVLALVRERPLTAGRLALIGFLAFAVVWAAVEPPLEDKAFGFGLLFLLALSAADIGREHNGPQAP
jgi:hypothetical protein